MSRLFSEFDILDYPLDRGKVLIEAAAGSGKTYTIQYLFLRLILERDDLDVSNILVVTFTEAATEELKERIRGILREAANLLAKVSKSRPLDVEKDGDLGRVLMQALGKGRSIPRLRDRLQQARTAFDEVVIATIHGFCSRMLSDYAFECGSRVGLELVKESRFFIQSVAEDYWRRTFYQGSELLVEAVVAQGLTLESLIELGLQLDRGPDLVVLPEVPESGSWAADMAHFVAEIDAVGRSFRSSCAVARNYLDNELEEIEKILFAGSPLNGRSWSNSKFPQYINNLEAALATTAWPDDDGFKALTKFSRDDLIKKTKNKKITPEHPLFHLCGELAAEVVRQQEFSGRLLCALKRDFLDFMAGPSGLKLCKEKSRKQGYSDYLTGLSQVLKGPSGGRLQELVAERFKVALVDEFQDTDPLQNSIFNTFFDRPEVLFYRIGDPKQSIYSFRGADIYAYLEVASGKGQKLATLDKNYRSTPRLLDAFNRIFSIPSPFLLDGIDYRKMICGQPL
ncbi:MAG: UvrD-helicase domain-containing protein, partial [Deltaproteobacteria bacterium]|nr:UvrD-helicase domain-containing protein [Deltaproteobacteria bacterium]